MLDRMPEDDIDEASRESPGEPEELEGNRLVAGQFIRKEAATSTRNVSFDSEAVYYSLGCSRFTNSSTEEKEVRVKEYQVEFAFFYNFSTLEFGYIHLFELHLSFMA